MKITIYISLDNADKLWKYKHDMPLDGEDVESVKYGLTNYHGTAVTLDYSFYKELCDKELLVHA